MKKCTTCKKEKSLNDFHASSSSPDGKFSICKICNNERNRVKYRNNSDYKNRKIKNKNAMVERSRSFILSYLRNNPCVDCGESDPVVLEFDHRGDKFLAVSQMVTRFCTRRVMEEVAKCDVRCANCHRRKTAIEAGYFTVKDKSE